MRLPIARALLNHASWPEANSLILAGGRPV
jgi:hypothetical protein